MLKFYEEIIKGRFKELVCARLRHVAGTQWGSKKYMNMKHLEAMERERLVG